MNQKELIQEISDCSKISNKKVSIILDAIIKCITDALKEEDKVTLGSFGTFQVKEKNSSGVRNQILKIPSKKVPVFTPGNDLKESLLIFPPNTPFLRSNIEEKVFIDPDSLYRHVEFLTKIKPTRAFNNTKSLQKAEEYIESEFKKIGLKTKKQIFKASEKPQAREREYCNIIGTINPDKSGIIVIGAHYDVCTGESKVNPGADDNASGVAGLIELAGILNKYEELIPYQIQFVAYANEEPPFFRTEYMGSYVHAKSLNDEKANVKFMIALEMIGYFSNNQGTQRFTGNLLKDELLKFKFPTVGNFIAIISNLRLIRITSNLEKSINNNSKIKCYGLSLPKKLIDKVEGLDFSDHQNYWKFKYNALMITDTAFLRNRNYHQKTDTIETLDFEKMAEVVKGIAYYFLSIK